LMTGFPLFSVRCRAHSASHILDLNTSEQSRPNASFRGIPVISSAARLKEVTRQFMSTVNTPSDMLSRIASVGAKNADSLFLSTMEDPLLNGLTFPRTLTPQLVGNVSDQDGTDTLPNSLYIFGTACLWLNMIPKEFMDSKVPALQNSSGWRSPMPGQNWKPIHTCSSFNCFVHSSKCLN
jgi:hypothetical protein